MAYKVPTSYVVTKAITINGVAYAKDAAISVAVVKGLRHSNALVSDGTIKPTPDPHRRRGKWRPWPTTVHSAHS